MAALKPMASVHKRLGPSWNSSPGRGGPRRRAGRLASGVGGRFHARALSWGAALVRGPFRRAARGRMPLTRSGNLPQGGIIALEVCLA